MKPVAGAAASLLAGALFPLALAPFKLWWFAPLPMLAVLLLLRGLPLAQRNGRLFLFALGQFGSGASWVYVSIHDYGYVPAPLAALLTFLFVAAMALLLSLPLWLWSRFLYHKPLGLLAAFPAVWVLDEWYRSWLLTGFPWLYLGYSQTETMAGGWAPLTGVYGISLWLALLAASLCHALVYRRLYWLPLLLLSFTFAGGAALDLTAWTQASTRQQTAALVQGNVPQQLKWRPEQREQIRNLYRRMSEPYWQQDALVVWPEAAIPELFSRRHPFFREMDAIAATTGSALLTGIPTYEEEVDGSPVYHNSLVGLGTAKGIYNKQRLVPFGEYVPLQQWLQGLLDFFHMPISEFRVGLPDQANVHTGTLSVATSICYEVAYPELVARQAREADILLTISNDSWFGNSLGPHQHLQMAQMRARENGREMLRATSNGISAVIDHKGAVVSRSPQFQPYVLQGTVRAYSGETPYQRFGNWPVLLACLCLLMLGYIADLLTTSKTSGDS